MLAIIDIGSNSVRMMLKQNNIKEKFSVVTKLIENKKDNVLDASAIKRTTNEIIKFVETAKEKNADIHIFATEALRSSDNSKEFIEEIFSKTGENVSVLDSKAEGVASFLGATNKRLGNLAVIDLGGASTEITLGKGANVNYSKSLPIGVVYLLEKCDKDKTKLDTEIKKQIKGLEKISFDTLIGVGGTITTLAAIDLNLKKYDGKKINGHVLSLKNILKITETLFSLSDKETLKMYGVQKGRESTLFGGSYFLCRLMDYYKADKILVSDNDNLEGYVLLNKLEKK